MLKLGIGTSLLCAMVATNVRADVVQTFERPGHITEASIVIDAPPEDVYAFVTDYRNWTKNFSDVKDVTVEGGGRDNARVRFKSKALGVTVTVQFANEPNKAIRFKGIKGPPGGRSSGEYLLTPIDGGKRTQVTASLYMDVFGPTKFVIRSDKLTGMRDAKLRADLVDVARHFGASTEPAKLPPAPGVP
jgi:hypothetical protein